MKKTLALLKKSPFVTAICTIVLCFSAIKLLDNMSDNLAGSVILRILMAIVCGAVVYSISGNKAYENLDKDIGYVLRKYLGFLIFGGVAGLVAFTPGIAGQATLVNNWAVSLLLAAVMVIFVGLFEELCFRVIINDAMLYQFRDNKHIFIWIGIVSTFVFGWVHVAGVPLGTPVAVAQAILKTLSTGLMGFGLLILYWKKRNFWAIALAHTIYDSLGLVAGLILDTGSELGSYVNEETKEVAGYVINMGYVQIGFYSFQLLLSIFLLIPLLKVLKSIDFEEIRREW